MNATAALRHRLGPPIGLLLLAPLVGEFLLGNQPITSLTGLIVLAPMYGGGALLIREVARRTGRGWPTMLVLAAAYGLLEEGLVDQMLFNPDYLGLDSFVGLGYVPALGISAWLTQGTLTLHTVWSIGVPIALVEALDRDRTRPWLGNAGLATVAVAFAMSLIGLGIGQYLHFRFIASPAQLVGVSAAIVTLVVLAFRFGRHQAPRVEAAAPSPLRVGAAAFALSSLYWCDDAFLPDDLISEWLLAAWWFVLAGCSTVLFVRWSRRRDWGPTHRLAVAAGALLTYVWAGFTQARWLEVSSSVAILGNVVFGASAIALLAAAVRASSAARAP